MFLNLNRILWAQVRHGRHLGHRLEGAFGGAPPPFLRDGDSLSGLADRDSDLAENTPTGNGPRFPRPHPSCSMTAMDFWTLLTIALAVLWAQANVIFCAGLHALRAEARVRWDALLSLEKFLLERRTEEDGHVAPEFLGWAEVLKKPILPENGPAVLGFYQHRKRWMELKHGTGFSVLELRCREAALRYAEAAALYNDRVLSLLGRPLSRWMGFAPVQGPPGQTASD